MSGGDTSSPPAERPQPPDCTNHSRTPAVWRCPACDLDLCADCVRTVLARGFELASCTSCGGQCVPAPQSEQQATTPQQQIDQRIGLVRDVQAPRILLALMTLILLGVSIASQGFLLGLVSTIAWLIIATAATAGGWHLSSKMGGDGTFDPLERTLLKIAAISVTLGACRASVWLMMGLSSPDLDGADTLVGLFIWLFVGAILLPILALTVEAVAFFELDPGEIVVTVVFLYLANTAAFILLAVIGLFA